MGMKSWEGKNVIKAWAHCYCARCWEHKRGTFTPTAFHFVFELLLTWINLRLIQENCGVTDRLGDRSFRIFLCWTHVVNFFLTWNDRTITPFLNSAATAEFIFLKIFGQKLCFWPHFFYHNIHKKTLMKDLFLFIVFDMFSIFYKCNNKLIVIRKEYK